jgi:transposase
LENHAGQASLPRTARLIEIIEMDRATQDELRRRARRLKTSRRDPLRARIVLLRCEGLPCREVDRPLSVSQNCVSKWSRRLHQQGGIDALKDQSGRGRKPSIPPDAAAQVVSAANCPPEGRTHWSIRSMAKASGMSRSSVQRLGSVHQIKPHRTRTVKVSNDLCFEETFRDMIGLGLDPPEKASVFCCDEKSQCQALGTEDRHTHVEWLRFLKQIDRETPRDLTLHLIADNCCAHKQEKAKVWLEKCPRFHMHFTPTSSAWLNLVERFFPMSRRTASGIEVLRV